MAAANPKATPPRYLVSCPAAALFVVDPAGLGDDVIGETDRMVELVNGAEVVVGAVTIKC